jgi:hypothetical protein
MVFLKEKTTVPQWILSGETLKLLNVEKHKLRQIQSDLCAWRDARRLCGQIRARSVRSRRRNLRRLRGAETVVAGELVDEEITVAGPASSIAGAKESYAVRGS